MDIFEVAALNATALDRRVAALQPETASPEWDRLERFAARVLAEGTVSVNMRLGPLLALLTTAGRHPPIYEWAANRARHSGRSEDVFLRERLGRFYAARRAFDDHFQDSRRFCYGALNIGGAGPTYYGDCCAMVAGPPAAWRLAYLQADSLQTYVMPGDVVDAALIAQEVAPHSHRHRLAVVKHSADLAGVAEEGWPGLLCSNTTYIEAIFVGDLSPAALSRVRMQRSDHVRYFDLAFNSDGSPLSDDARIVRDSFVMVLDALRGYGIALEVCDDA